MDIENLLSSKPHNPNYINRYIKYLELCVKRNEKVKPLVSEKHHICPKAESLFPEYTNFSKYPWNKILLSRRQHLFAHRILNKLYGGPMTISLFLMLQSKWYDLKISDKEIINLKNEYGRLTSERMKKTQSGEGNNFYGKKHTEEHKNNLRKRKWSDETRRKISEANKKPCPEYKKRKIGETLKGRSYPEKTGNGNPMTKVFKVTDKENNIFYVTSYDFKSYCKAYNLKESRMRLYMNKGAIPDLNKYEAKTTETYNTIGMLIELIGRLKELSDIKLHAIPLISS